MESSSGDNDGVESCHRSPIVSAPELASRARNRPGYVLLTGEVALTPHPLGNFNVVFSETGIYSNAIERSTREIAREDSFFAKVP